MKIIQEISVRNVYLFYLSAGAFLYRLDLKKYPFNLAHLNLNMTTDCYLIEYN